MAQFPSLCQVNYGQETGQGDIWDASSDYRCRSVSGRHGLREFHRICDTQSQDESIMTLSGCRMAQSSRIGRPETVQSMYSNLMAASRTQTLPSGYSSHDSYLYSLHSRSKTSPGPTLPNLQRSQSALSWVSPQDEKLKWVPALNAWVSEKSSQNAAPYMSFVSSLQMSSRDLPADHSISVAGTELANQPCSRFLAHLHSHKHAQDDAYAKLLNDSKLTQIRKRQVTREETNFTEPPPPPKPNTAKTKSENVMKVFVRPTRLRSSPGRLQQKHQQLLPRTAFPNLKAPFKNFKDLKTITEDLYLAKPTSKSSDSSRVRFIKTQPKPKSSILQREVKKPVQPPPPPPPPHQVAPVITTEQDVASVESDLRLGSSSDEGIFELPPPGSEYSGDGSTDVDIGSVSDTRLDFTSPDPTPPTSPPPPPPKVPIQRNPPKKEVKPPKLKRGGRQRVVTKPVHKVIKRAKSPRPKFKKVNSDIKKTKVIIVVEEVPEYAELESTDDDKKLPSQTTVSGTQVDTTDQLSPPKQEVVPLKAIQPYVPTQVKIADPPNLHLDVKADTPPQRDVPKRGPLEKRTRWRASGANKKMEEEPEVVQKTASQTKSSDWIFDGEDFSTELPVLQVVGTEEPPKLPTPPPVMPSRSPTPEEPSPRKIKTPPPLRKVPMDKKKRWGQKKLDKSWEEEMRRQRLAEERRKKAQLMYDKLRNKKAAAAEDVDLSGAPKFEDYGFLARYCIFNRDNMAMYKRAFDAVDEDRKGWLEATEAFIALRGINHKLNDAEEEYMYRVLEMTGYKVTDGADFKLFAVMAALSQKITALDDWMKNLIGHFDFKMLERKMYKCRTLWECNVDPETNRISIDQLCLELKAGGVSYEHQLEVQEKLGHLEALDLLDFLTYIPLFIMIHQSVVFNPLDDARDK